MASLIFVYADLHIEKLAAVAGQAHLVVLLADVENVLH